MKIRVPLRRLVPCMPLIATAGLLLPRPASALEWVITPGIDVRETYTDNLTLAPDGDRKSGFVTELAPRVALSATGPRLRINADYTMRNFYSRRDGDDFDTQHLLQANANGELVRELLFLDLSASSATQVVSPFGRQATDRGDLGNTAETQSYRVSPYLRHHFGRRAIGELRYSHDQVKSSGNALNTSEANAWRASLDSGPDFRRLHWSVAVDAQDIDMESGADVETRAVSGTLQYDLTPQFAWTATAGYEDNEYAALGGAPEGKVWSTGFVWKPSSRSSLSASMGRRYFGQTWSLQAMHRTYRTTWNLGYEEAITTTRSQFLLPMAIDTAAMLNGMWRNSVPDDLLREEMVRKFMRDANLAATLTTPVNSFSNQVYLQKSANLAVAFRGARLTGMATLFHVDRVPQSVAGAGDVAVPGGGGLLGAATRQRGASVLLNWALSSRSSLAASAGYNRTHTSLSDRVDNNMSYQLTFARQLQKNVRGGIELRRTEKKSDSSIDECREHAVAVFLQLSL